MKSKKIWCAVSGHGYGHWSQMVPVLHMLLAARPDLTLHVTGSIPTALIQRTLRHPVTHDLRSCDVCLIQPDPMQVDLAATAAAMRLFHDDWPERVAREAALMAAWQPDLILGNIPCLPMEAGKRLGIPTVALTSLTWDEVITAYFPPDAPEIAAWLATMRNAYAQATLALRITPALPDHPFPESRIIPAITTSGIERATELRHALGIAPHDTRPLVLLTLGGIPTRSFPLARLNTQRDFHWILDQPLEPDSASHLHALDQLPTWPFADLLASVDALISKPGYGMACSAMAHRIPFLYLRRGIFPDEPPILEWCAQHGRVMEIRREAFQQGQFSAPLTTLLAQPAPPAPEVNGAEVAARMLMERFLE
ncbi:MAG: hypothetical protein HQL91_04585 [Magnetococcales bacterium]|nr:hypothetical protein [Magnetococcales bacterium]